MKEAKKFIDDRSIRYELKTYIDDLKCGDCVRGWLRPTGEAKEGKIPHTCTHCGRVAQVLGDPYPRTVVVRQQITGGNG